MRTVCVLLVFTLGQAAVDELLLEVFEHLPQTVKGFKGEMAACTAVLEPESVIPSYAGIAGPLSVALHKRQQMETYCTIPLVLDYMSRKFTKGLPSLRDREGVLEKNSKLTDTSAQRDFLGRFFCFCLLRDGAV